MDLSRIRLLVCDVDGVLTDGTVTVDDLGRESCRYSKRDGVLLPAMKEAGIDVVAMTAEALAGLRVGEDGTLRPGFNVHHNRCNKLGIALHTCAPDYKLDALRSIAESYEVPLSEVAYIGDDLPDLPCLEAVAEAGGFAVVPDRSAAWYAAARSGFIVHRYEGLTGGDGVLRAVCASLLTARGYDCNRWPVVKR